MSMQNKSSDLKPIDQSLQGSITYWKLCRCLSKGLIPISYKGLSWEQWISHIAPLIAFLSHHQHQIQAFMTKLRIFHQKTSNKNLAEQAISAISCSQFRQTSTNIRTPAPSYLTYPHVLLQYGH